MAGDVLAREISSEWGGLTDLHDESMIPGTSDSEG